MSGKTLAEVVGIDLNLGEKKIENLIRQSLKAENGEEDILVKKITENRSLDQYF